MSTEEGARTLAPDYPVVTDRLLLRPIDPVEDIEAMHAYRSREDVCRYIPPVPVTRAQLAATYADPERTRSVLTAPGQILSLAIVLRETGRLIGDIILIRPEGDPHNGEVGYIVDPDHQGHGYATEAVRAVLALGFDGLGLHRVGLDVLAINPRAQALYEGVGFRVEGRLREAYRDGHRWCDAIVMGILEDEFRSAAQA